jgi:hypothetical protein
MNCFEDPSGDIVVSLTGQNGYSLPSLLYKSVENDYTEANLARTE